MTNQEVFDFVLTKLTEQGVASTAPNRFGSTDCKYRGANGTKCAAGWLIGDHAYRPDLEGRVCTSEGAVEALRDSGVPPSALRLVRALQQAHDHRMPRDPGGSLMDFYTSMGRIAKNYRLEFNMPAQRA